MLADIADVNGIYEESLINLKERKPIVKPQNHTQSEAEREMAAKNYYASVRTNVSPSATFFIFTIDATVRFSLPGYCLM